jgi:hypothetical protein
LFPLWPTVWLPPHHTCRPVPRVVSPSFLPFPVSFQRPPQKRNASRRLPNPNSTPDSLAGSTSRAGLSPFPFQSPHARARSPPRVGPRSRWPRAAAPCSRSSSSATAGERFGSPLPPARALCLLSLADLCFPVI